MIKIGNALECMHVVENINFLRFNINLNVLDFYRKNYSLCLNRIYKL